MKNKLTDLNNVLFEQLERLMDDSLSKEEFEKEVERSKQVTGVARIIVDNAEIQLQAFKQMQIYGIGDCEKMPELLSGE